MVEDRERPMVLSLRARFGRVGAVVTMAGIDGGMFAVRRGAAQVRATPQSDVELLLIEPEKHQVPISEPTPNWRSTDECHRPIPKC